jgi:hypothetical protein
MGVVASSEAIGTVDRARYAEEPLMSPGMRKNSHG